MLALKFKNQHYNVDPRKGQWIDPLIVNFDKQVLINDQYKDKLLVGKKLMYSLTYKFQPNCMCFCDLISCPRFLTP